MKNNAWSEEAFEEALLVVFLLLMALVMGAQVFSRYVMRSSLTWTEEIARYLFIWSGFVSIGYCIRKRMGLRVDIALTVLPGRVALLMRILALFLEMALFVYLLPFAYAILEVAVEKERLSPATRMPMWMLQSAPFVGFLLAAIRVGQRLGMEFRGDVVPAAGNDSVHHYVEDARDDLRLSGDAGGAGGGDQA